MGRFFPITGPGLHGFKEIGERDIFPFFGMHTVLQFRAQLPNVVRKRSLVIHLIVFHP